MLGSDMNPGKLNSLFKFHKEHKECELPPVGPIIIGCGSTFKNAGIFIEQHIILDRVGPVDNRPSTDKLYHFVRKKIKIKCDM